MDGVEGDDAIDADIGVSATGEAVVGWSQRHRRGWLAMAKRWTGTAWEPAVRVQQFASSEYAGRRGLGLPGGPNVIVADDGQAWMLWARTPPASYPRLWPRALVSSWRLPSGEWAPEQTVMGDTTDSGGADAVPLPGGELLVAWTEAGALRTARLSPVDRWRFGFVAGEGVARTTPSLAALPGGNTLVSWAHGAYLPQPFTDLAVSLVGLALDTDAPTLVAPSGVVAPRVAFSASGRVFVAWIDGTTVWARTAPSIALPFEPPVALATLPPPTGFGTGPRSLSLVADDLGNATAAWLDGGFDPPTRVAAARYANGGPWGPAVTLYQGPSTTSYAGPGLAVDGQGNVFVAFSVAPTRSGYEVLVVRSAGR